MAARLAEISPAAQHMVRLNDTVHPLTPRCSFPKLAEQMDVHEGTATVREAMQFSALLRQPAHVPRSEKEAYVEELIELLELQDLADALVFSLGVEARKRLTIGVELASKPELLLFLDE